MVKRLVTTRVGWKFGHALPVATGANQSKVRVGPSSTPYHVERGWTQKGRTYKGHFRTRFGAWPGKIVDYGGFHEVFIFKPPMKQIRNDPYHICFYRLSKDTYRINLALQPSDNEVSSIVLKVEAYLSHCFTKTQGSNNA